NWVFRGGTLPNRHIRRLLVVFLPYETCVTEDMYRRARLSQLFQAFVQINFAPGCLNAISDQYHMTTAFGTIGEHLCGFDHRFEDARTLAGKQFRFQYPRDLLFVASPWLQKFSPVG